VAFILGANFCGVHTQQFLKWGLQMKLTVLTIAALALAGSACAQSGSHQACQGDPKCFVVAATHPRLQTAEGVPATGMYVPSEDAIYLSKERIERTPECAAIIKQHEDCHRQQHRDGRLLGREFDAELEAQQYAPTYNCGSYGHRGTPNNYVSR
jgi:hypothetical protein